MKINSVKSIRTKIIISILPIILIAMVIMTTISYQRAKGLVNNEIANKMQKQLDATVQNVEKSLLRHSEIAETLAKTAQVSLNSLSKEQYAELLKGAINTNKETFGAGIWFEPYKYKTDTKLFGPYAYKKDGQLVFAEEYSSEDYNYLKYDWYNIGKNTSKNLEWSDAYVD